MEDFSHGTRIFKEYVPFTAYANLKHPEKISQTVTLSCVTVSPPTYSHSIPEKWLRAPNSRLSGVQMDAIILAGAAHEKTLDIGRQGFIVGDGTGLGKGREIVGMIVDNWIKGRTKCLWLSTSRQLMLDAERDLNDVIKKDLTIPMFRGEHTSDWIEESCGIVFASYHFVGKQDLEDNYPVLKNFEEWVGKDFDGLIVLDEAHKAKGLEMSPLGESTGTSIGKAVEKMQQVFTNARFVYASATIGTTPEDLHYVQRIGLWNEKDGFGGAEAMKFFSERGLAGSEVLSAELKRRGVMVSRHLSYENVEFSILESELTNEFICLYDKCSRLWRLVLELTNEEEGLQPYYWSTTQSFFKTMCIGSKLPSLLNLISDKISENHSVVLSLTSTHDELFKRFRDGGFHDADKEVFRPCKQMIEEFLITKLHFESSRLLSSNAKPKNARLDDTIEEIISVFHEIKKDLPCNPLDILRMKFKDMPEIVELTSRRYYQELVDVNGRVTVVKHHNNHQEAASKFQNGDCRVAIISEASSTGISLHCSTEVNNQQQRVHIMLETPWTSLSALQSLGRSHRSGQVTVPKYILLTSPFPGEKRFVNAVAGRICNLGALCKADRRSSFNDVWKTFQVCPKVAEFAIENVLNCILGRPSNMNLFPIGQESKRDRWQDIVKQVKLIVESKRATGGYIPCVRLKNQEKFLNRLIVLEYKQQRVLMNFFEAAIQRATETYPESMNDGVEALSYNVAGELTFVKTFTYANAAKLECNLHWFDSTDICTLSTVLKKDVTLFYRNSKGKMLGVKPVKNTNTVEIFKPSRCKQEKRLNACLRGYSVVSNIEGRSIWEKQMQLLMAGNCTKSVHGKCRFGTKCTLHRKSVSEFVLFTGVISTVLMDLVQNVNVREMNLCYHTWDNQSDTGIYIPEKHIPVLIKCLSKAGFCKK